MKFYTTILLLLFTALPLTTAAEVNVNPDINRYYQDAEYQNWVGTFERPGREVFDKRHAVVEALQLKPGMEIADIGAGTGFYSLLFADQVGTAGKVYAVDIVKDFIDNIMRLANEKGLANIHGIISRQNDTGLAPHSVDMVFICDTYHHFEFPQTMLASIRQALRPGGQLIIIDFRKQPGISSRWVMGHVRANKDTVIKEVEDAGFKLHSEPALLKSNYFLRFIKP